MMNHWQFLQRHEVLGVALLFILTGIAQLVNVIFRLDFIYFIAPSGLDANGSLGRGIILLTGLLFFGVGVAILWYHFR